GGARAEAVTVGVGVEHVLAAFFECFAHDLRSVPSDCDGESIPHRSRLRGLRRAGHGELRLDLARMLLYAVADCLPRPSAHARPYADAALGPLLTQNLCDRVAAPHAVEDPERISHVRLAARIGADQQRERIQREGRVLEALEIQQAEAGE